MWEIRTEKKTKLIAFGTKKRCGHFINVCSCTCKHSTCMSYILWNTQHTLHRTYPTNEHKLFWYSFKKLLYELNTFNKHISFNQSSTISFRFVSFPSFSLCAYLVFKRRHATRLHTVQSTYAHYCIFYISNMNLQFVFQGKTLLPSKLYLAWNVEHIQTHILWHCWPFVMENSIKTT